jgi:hypothetical protein
VADLKKFAPHFEQMMPGSYRKIIGNRSKIEEDGSLFDSIVEL